MPAAMAARVTFIDWLWHMYRGTHRGRYFAFDRYRLSSCQNFEATDSTAPVSRITGPAPTRSAALNIPRNIAKFSEIRTIPRSRQASTSPATMNSVSPFSAARLAAHEVEG